MIRVNQRDQLQWQEGMTVQDVLDAMHYSYVLISVTVNEEFIPKDNYADHLVPDQAEVNIFHLAHGG